MTTLTSQLPREPAPQHALNEAAVLEFLLANVKGLPMTVEGFKIRQVRVHSRLLLVCHSLSS